MKQELLGSNKDSRIQGFTFVSILKLKAIKTSVSIESYSCCRATINKRNFQSRMKMAVCSNAKLVFITRWTRLKPTMPTSPVVVLSSTQISVSAHHHPHHLPAVAAHHHHQVLPVQVAAAVLVQVLALPVAAVHHRAPPVLAAAAVLVLVVQVLVAVVLLLAHQAQAVPVPALQVLAAAAVPVPVLAQALHHQAQVQVVPALNWSAGLKKFVKKQQPLQQLHLLQPLKLPNLHPLALPMLKMFYPSKAPQMILLQVHQVQVLQVVQVHQQQQQQQLLQLLLILLLIKDHLET